MKFYPKGTGEDMNEDLMLKEVGDAGNQYTGDEDDEFDDYNQKQFLMRKGSSGSSEGESCRGKLGLSSPSRDLVEENLIALQSGKAGTKFGVEIIKKNIEDDSLLIQEEQPKREEYKLDFDPIEFT